MFKVMLFGMLLLGCKAVKNHDTKELHLLKATRQKLYAGAKGGGIMTEYYIKVYTSSAQALYIDTVWADSKKFHPKILDEKTHAPVKNIQAGDTLLLMFSVHSSEFGPEEANKAAEDAPIYYKGAALLRFYPGSMPEYLVIPAFTDLEPVYAP